MPTLESGKSYPSTQIFSTKDIVRNDIVVFDINWSSASFIKRVLVMPFDNYEFKINWNDANYYINGKKLITLKGYKSSGVYKSAMFYKKSLIWVVPAGHYLVFWDNHKNSNDSVEYWYILINKMLFKLTTK